MSRCKRCCQGLEKHHLTLYALHRAPNLSPVVFFILQASWVEPVTIGAKPQSSSCNEAVVISDAECHRRQAWLCFSIAKFRRSMSGA